MRLSYEIVIQVLTVLVFFAGIMIVLIFANKFQLRHKIRRSSKVKKFLIEKYIQGKSLKKKIRNRIVLDEFVNIREQMQIGEDVSKKIMDDFDAAGFVNAEIRHLRSWSRYVRKRSIHYLSFFDMDKVKLALIKRFRKERNESVKLYFANSLKNRIDGQAIDVLVESLVGSSQAYRNRIIEMIKHYHNECCMYVKQLFDRNEFEIKELIIEFANVNIHDELRMFLKAELLRMESFLKNEKGSIHYISKKRFPVEALWLKCLNTLDQVYGESILIDKYLHHSNQAVQKIVIDAKARNKDLDGIKSILEDCDGGVLDNYRIEVISRIAENNRDLYMDLLNLFHLSHDATKQKVLASILAFKTDYLVLKLNSPKRNLIARTLKAIVQFGYAADLIGFMNNNKDLILEKDLLNIVGPLILNDDQVRTEFTQYLDERILMKMGMQKNLAKSNPKPHAKVESTKVEWLVRIFLISLFTFPIIFFFRYLSVFQETDWMNLLIYYVVDINYYMVAYYVLVNIIYIILIVLSYFGAKDQLRLWRLKHKTMLFEKGMLSSISILAPAYNEELSIIDNVDSLLNLNYPTYEVIVINDGSKDGTLNRLIEHFKLERKNVIVERSIRTRNIKGVYRNKHIPNLTVIDKENGGKADALNVGINLAKNEFVCGIDADSMLEAESLLKLMSVTIDSGVKTIALGGNIIPANGCVIDRGQVEVKGLPSTILARLQAIEYLRAFTSGRIGWAKMKSLLIVSGAFGLFDRNLLISAGGYLTSSSIHKKDTVGEDMEIVVRLARIAFEKKMRHSINYVYNALCYTEVPTDLKSLLKQRNRWHRGLIDILSYHRSLIFNPRYKQVGVIGLPYFVIFEMIGPLFEVQGYIMLVLALIFGLLNTTILLAIFTGTVMFGIIVSLISLYINEQESQYLGIKDTILLIVYAVLENLGYRQFISLYRVKGFFASLRETGAWGSMERTGFKKK